MNRKRISLSLVLVLLCAAAFESRRALAAGGLPAGWVKSGDHPDNYEMVIDTSVKHGGKASAHIKFTGEKAEGFGTLGQGFRADEYRGKRLRMSAWMKTESVDAAHLWLRLDAERATVGFDNMDNRAVKGTSQWQRYDLTLDVPAETVNVAFGVFVVGRGEAWVDDFRFEVVGAEVATTDLLTPEMRRQERPYKATAGGNRARPANLDFEAGAYREPKIVQVDPKMYDDYAGQYQSEEGPVVTVTREGDRLMQEQSGGVKNELLPLSAIEFFSPNNPQGTVIFVRNAQGQVTHYVRRRGGRAIIVRKIK
jgi:hypothetical protein